MIIKGFVLFGCVSIPKQNKDEDYKAPRGTSCRIVCVLFCNFVWLEQFDKDSKAKEKGRISVKFQDKDSNLSQNSEQPCQVHQN